MRFFRDVYKEIIMKAVIISGGRIQDYAYTKSQITAGDTIICADSGYNHAVKMGVQVDYLLGDFDSIGTVPGGVKTLRFPAKKDFTDTELAVEFALNHGYKDILLLAATGARMDHGLTNIFLLKHVLLHGAKAVIVDEHNKIALTDSRLEIKEAPKSIVSLVPLTDCLGVCTTGLEYPLENATMRVGKGLGVSNIVVSSPAVVSLKEGLLLVIVACD